MHEKSAISGKIKHTVKDKNFSTDKYSWRPQEFFMLTKAQLVECVPNIRAENLNKFYNPLNKAMKKYNINTKLRIAAFVSQLAHESGSFNRVEENLNYSEQGLRRVFGKYFRTRNPSIYARQPEKIANVVYANRIGNSNVSSGDGWRYRGRGLIQLTGKANYIQAGKALGVDLIKNPDWLTTAEGATMSAAWFWDMRSLNELADKQHFRTITRRINGGLNGLDDRLRYYNTALKVLGV